MASCSVLKRLGTPPLGRVKESWMLYRASQSQTTLAIIQPPVVIGKSDCHQPSRRQRISAPSALPLGAVALASGAGAAPALLPGVLPVVGPWGVWTALVSAGAVGLWSEKNTRIGRELSGALVATLIGMFLANVGVLPANAPELNVVYKYILPLAVPMLLFSANLKRMLSETGRLLLAFLLGSVMTVIGGVTAMAVFPLGPHLGDAGWRVASALTARHIGGAVNYMSVSEMLQVPPSVFGAGLAADDLILTFYFTSLYTLAKNIPPDTPPTTQQQNSPPYPTKSVSVPQHVDQGIHTSPDTSHIDAAPAADSLGKGDIHAGGIKNIMVLEGLMALSLSSLICYLATMSAQHLSAPSQMLTFVTGITVALATLAPRALAPLVPSAEGLAQVLMQVFYATIGASANVSLVIKTAPVLFLYCAIALSVHLLALLGLGKLFGFTRKELLIASNANIGGPSTVAGMAAAKGWTSSIVPGILTSTLGYAIGNLIGMVVGQTVLIKM